MTVEISKAVVEDGKMKSVETRTVEPHKCPHFILSFEHYRENGSCKCDDPGEIVMRKWGYKWSREKGQWV